MAYNAKMAKARSGRNLIYALKDRQGVVRYGTEGVVDVAHGYYTDLFTSEGMDERVQEAILDKLTRTLSQESHDMCEGGVSVGELGEALGTLQNGKAPGEDGFPAEFWKFFWADLAGDFMGVVEWVYESGCLPESMRGGVIRLLYKKGDKLDMGNYHPVTLVNADYKIQGVASQRTCTSLGTLWIIAMALVHRLLCSVWTRRSALTAWNTVLSGR